MAGRIEDYGVIGDLRTMALVGTDGSIDWLCLPRFDSAACFAALLGDDRAGRWLLAPVGAGYRTRRRYRGESLVLETDWEGPGGTVRVIDFMPLRGGAGEVADVVRIVQGVSGRVPMRMELGLRFDYGSVTPWLTGPAPASTAGGPADPHVALAGPDSARLDTPVPVNTDGGRWTSEFEVSAGDRIPFVLTHGPSHLPVPGSVGAEDALRDTEAFWAGWIARCRYRGEWADAVRSSLVVLKGLTYAPTGGIVAAATTSLPEEIGGARNWDYRYCWLRDATLTLSALLATGYLDEARAWREWLLRAVAADPADMRIMYGLHGERRLPEAELPHLAGYEGSKPVRVGNGAAEQYQLDVWGEVLDGLHVGREAGIAPVEQAWDLQRGLLHFLEGHWQDPDNGLWEMRGPRRHFVHSKVLAWAGVDRAVRAVERFGLDGPVRRWRELRARIHDEVCAQGFDAERRTFTQFYGSAGLDAALLLIPRVGFLPWSDERIRGTVAAVERELCEDGLLLRYRPELDGGVDGLPGGEGAFLACSFWLAHAQHATGRTDEGRALFERLLGLRNDVGLLAEEYDPRRERHLGNTPQAFSHLALVDTALHIERGAQCVR
ncbi:MAG: glycoside hydrolase family 15 protein [Pseudonocardia sp.]|nr:glycoside hydrolase family 15 protein [Pseudonocardia sp.]